MALFNSTKNRLAGPLQQAPLAPAPTPAAGAMAPPTAPVFTPIGGLAVQAALKMRKKAASTGSSIAQPTGAVLPNTGVTKSLLGF